MARALRLALLALWALMAIIALAASETVPSSARTLLTPFSALDVGLSSCMPLSVSVKASGDETFSLDVDASQAR